MNHVALCGPILIGGFAGTSLPEAYDRSLRQGRRGGAILFAANVSGDLAGIAALARQIHAALPAPLLAIDQEGGRVARLGAPFLVVPTMRSVASWGNAGLAERIAAAVGLELAAVGFTLAFAPILDVNTCDQNPVIGDRSFAADPFECARFGVAWSRGLQSTGLLATGKHFPGHGDTSKDSHFELPVVDATRARLDAVELVPFRAAADAGLAALMTAHVVYRALDAERPATLSRAICTDLRREIGFDGLLVSDDLEMKGITSRTSVAEAAVQAVAAGCDALLICHTHDEQEAALDALVREADRSPAFRARCQEAKGRVDRARRRAVARPLDDSAIARVVGGPASQAIASEMAEKLRTAGASP